MQPSIAAVEKPFVASCEKFGEIIECLGSAKTFSMTHSELETLITAKGTELMRQLLQDHLDLRGVGEVDDPVRGADGVERTHRRVGERRLMSIFGPVMIARMGYGARGAMSLYPRDAELNLPRESYSLGVRRRIADQAALNSFDEAVGTVRATSGGTVAKRQAEELATRAAQDYDAFYEQREEASRREVKESGPVLVISPDGKGVTMRTEALREETRKKAQKRERKLSKRLTKGEKRDTKRMAMVCTVFTVGLFRRAPEDIVRELAPVRELDLKRPRPENKRVWASLEKEPEEVLDDAFAEALRRDPERTKTWVGLSDGNETQLRLLSWKAREHGVTLTIIVDIIHVIEYLWRAVTCFEKEGSKEAEQWVTERLLHVLQGKAVHVAAGIRRSATLRGLTVGDRAAADDCADYLLKYSCFLRYNEYLAAGLPIATGVIEGACRHLVQDRMALTGARWGLKTAEAVLRLRSIRSSGDFDEYWCFHEQQEHFRNHVLRYDDSGIPSTPQPDAVRRAQRPKLHLVP
jgi:hypothetical protein